MAVAGFSVQTKLPLRRLGGCRTPGAGLPRSAAALPRRLTACWPGGLADPGLADIGAWPTPIEFEVSPAANDRPARQTFPSERHRFPGGPAPAAGCQAREPREGAAGIPDPQRQHPRWSLCRRSGHGRAHHRTALCVRHTARPSGVGCRPSGLPAQGADRAARPPAHHQAGRGPGALSGAPRERVRHLRSRTLEHLDQRSVGHGGGGGAMTAGMAFEALNHAGSLPADLLVILNDNDMSISENVGALSNHFARALSGRVYAHLREGGKKVLRQMPTVWELARRSEEHLKGMVLPGTLFEEMGFNYIGPMDGHDVKALV